MIKLAHKTEVETLKDLPAEVIEKVLEIVTILDENYGDTREKYDLGGYVLIAEVLEDVETIKELIDFQYTLPEYVELISCQNGGSYTNSFMLLSSDYSISLLIPNILTPEKLLIHLEDNRE
ncbi:hypothetical protein [Clostridium estertheticum]|uniref:Uncharacterized protein n=1 Tax=Clostridium estertheticum subsp. estertheticum TaxID=1552 RepID=A0A1J0GBZ6_9CLOT|nr:hypothetical protein [Clostridium estertheticum]APC38884.1 hypothetical protein A7L45_01770 [Clostridium estertheticum subsp. estertheticum]MBZ9615172.1 hypothetical protein [Clostridium estertheticum subsp. laramiense]WAG75065.1 hypothetical protein LL032_06335 [Clostridium estertheticum]